MCKQIFAIFLGLIFMIKSFSQFPGNVELYQIKTKNYKIIFPKEISEKARKLSAFLEKIHSLNTYTLNTSPKRLPIVLNNYSAISNGYTAFGPRHCFWYMTPYSGIDLGISQWDKLLGIHEIRHNIQFTALDRNFNKILHILSGQWGLAGGVNWSIPNWFLEGDAEFWETILTASGRGRVGRFAMPVKAIALDYNKKDLNYYKFFYRSYRKYYPNQYYLGYYLVTYINRHYGPQIWNNILYHSTKFSFLPNSMHLSLKKYTSLTYRKLFDSTFNELKTLWQQERNKNQFAKIYPLPYMAKRTFTNYFNPYFINDTQIVVVKSGFDNLPTLTLINRSTGEEKKLKTLKVKDIYYANNYVIWSEINPHIRWSEASFSNIYLYDILDKKLKKITSKGRFFSPTVSPDARHIASVKLESDLQPNIVIIDIKTKQIIQTFRFPDLEFIRFLRYTPDGKELIFTATNSKGNSLYKLNLKTANSKILIDHTSKFIIEKPLKWKNFIIFTADISGSENVFALDTNNKQIYQITNHPYSAIANDLYQKTGELLIYRYTIKGFEPAIVYLYKNNWQKVEKFSQENYFISPKTHSFIQDLTSKEFDTKNITIKKYRRGLNLINPHSWLWNFNYNNTSYDASITLYSQDVLKELNLELSTTYRNTGQITNNLSFTYKHFYPIVELKLQHTRNLNNTSSYIYNELNFAIPFNLSRNIWYRIINIKEKNFIALNLENKQIVNALGAQISLQNTRFRSYRDMESRFSQFFYFDFTNLLFYNDFQLTTALLLKLPGLLKHDVININLYNQKLTDNDFLIPQISLPSGYYNIKYNDIKRAKILYHFPLFYPDWGWGPVFNIKRIRTKLFYDLAIVDKYANYSSAGLQILFDFNLFGINVDLSTGIEFTLKINDNKFVILPVIDYIPIN